MEVLMADRSSKVGSSYVTSLLFLIWFSVGVTDKAALIAS